ncbi:MAG TPA: LPXTG cell wall anchor domain-containing protein [Actinomycetota bacterium]|nr:LPXTG cell wall anchor domain-containing protein [Actinomycetota bacterium]
MRKMAMTLTGAMVFAVMTAGTAFAQYTGSPPPEAVVEGAGGGVGQAAGAGGETAFTGGDASTAAMVALALVAIGLVALFVARRRAAASS